MNEEPTQRAVVVQLMNQLKSNVLKPLIRTHDLDAPVVAEAETLLGDVAKSASFHEATAVERVALENALTDWVNAVQEWMHRSNSN